MYFGVHQYLCIYAHEYVEFVFDFVRMFLEKREDDSLAIDQDEILQMATKYYRDLLAPTLTEAPPIN